LIGRIVRKAAFPVNLNFQDSVAVPDPRARQTSGATPHSFYVSGALRRSITGECSGSQRIPVGKSVKVGDILRCAARLTLLRAFVERLSGATTIHRVLVQCRALNIVRKGNLRERCLGVLRRRSRSLVGGLGLEKDAPAAASGGA
jgi:hypothetical protein